jgi:single-stranded DNA-binding protein
MVLIAGRLTRGPEMRDLAGGTVFTTFIEFPCPRATDRSPDTGPRQAD